MELGDHLRASTPRSLVALGRSRYAEEICSVPSPVPQPPYPSIPSAPLSEREIVSRRRSSRAPRSYSATLLSRTHTISTVYMNHCDKHWCSDLAISFIPRSYYPAFEWDSASFSAIFLSLVSRASRSLWGWEENLRRLYRNFSDWSLVSNWRYFGAKRSRLWILRLLRYFVCFLIIFDVIFLVYRL